MDCSIRVKCLNFKLGSYSVVFKFLICYEGELVKLLFGKF